MLPTDSISNRVHVPNELLIRLYNNWGKDPTSDSEWQHCPNVPIDDIHVCRDDKSVVVMHLCI